MHTGPRLALSRIHGDDDISEQERDKGIGLLFKGSRRDRFMQGKRQDIGTFLDVSVSFIKLTDVLVPDQNNAQLPVLRALELLQSFKSRLL